jgi:hypothetical protein
MLCSSLHAAKGLFHQKQAFVRFISSWSKLHTTWQSSVSESESGATFWCMLQTARIVAAFILLTAPSSCKRTLIRFKTWRPKVNKMVSFMMQTIRYSLVAMLLGRLPTCKSAADISLHVGPMVRDSILVLILNVADCQGPLQHSGIQKYSRA